jgi:hypothetical protein
MPATGVMSRMTLKVKFLVQRGVDCGAAGRICCCLGTRAPTRRKPDRVGDEICRGPYSALMPAALTIGHHFSISAF